MPQPPVLLSTDYRGVATITLNRPEVGNAHNSAMLDGLIHGLTSLRAHPVARCLVLPGAGKRASSEGIEGTTAFQQKRKPSWYDPVHPNV
jgi:enoyl-CoA hydratase/carnithine racemase